MERIRRPRWHLAALLLAVPALALGFAWTALADSSPSPAAAGGTPGAAVAGDKAKGMATYNQNCTACHGGNLEGGIGPKLNPLEKLPGTANPKDPAYLTGVIANGLQGKGSYSSQMPAWKGKLSDADIQNVIAYILDLNAQGGGGSISPSELARSNVLWVTIGVGLMVVLTFLLARYNMRWIARRAAARSGRP